MKFKTGDKVVVIAGKDKGHIGSILAINSKTDKVIVEGAGMKTYTVKPTNENPEGGVERKEGPMHISNVMAFASQDKDGNVKVSKIAIKRDVDAKTGRKVKTRILKKTGEEL